MDEILAKAEQILFRMADGDVSEEDTQFIVDNIPVISDKLQEQLQSLVDSPGEIKRIQYALAAINTYRLWKMFS